MVRVAGDSENGDPGVLISRDPGSHFHWYRGSGSPIFGTAFSRQNRPVYKLESAPFASFAKSNAVEVVRLSVS